VPNDETLIHPEQPRFLLSSWLWAVVLFVFFGVIVAITFGAMHRGSTYEEDRAKARAEKLKTAQDEWSKTSSSYGWVDKGKGVAHIPIHRAMMLELADLQSKKPAPAGPIATPEPAAAPGTKPAAAQPTPKPSETPPPPQKPQNR
jgi:outer membrane biosynthesis protein TonB